MLLVTRSMYRFMSWSRSRARPGSGRLAVMNDAPRGGGEPPASRVSRAAAAATGRQPPAPSADPLSHVRQDLPVPFSDNAPSPLYKPPPARNNARIVTPTPE